MEKLHLGAKYIFFLRHFLTLLLDGIFILMIVAALYSGNPDRWTILLIWSSVFLVISFVLAIILSALSYNNYTYEFRKEGIFIEKGIIWKKYSTIPYERIQNVDLTRGVFARILGFSTMHIHTAGYSNGQGLGAEGVLPAIDIQKAEYYRGALLDALRRKKQGL